MDRDRDNCLLSLYWIFLDTMIAFETKIRALCCKNNLSKIKKCWEIPKKRP